MKASCSGILLMNFMTWKCVNGQGTCTLEQTAAVCPEVTEHSVFLPLHHRRRSVDFDFLQMLMLIRVSLRCQTLPLPTTTTTTTTPSPPSLQRHPTAVSTQGSKRFSDKSSSRISAATPAAPKYPPELTFLDLPQTLMGSYLVHFPSCSKFY